MLALGFDSPVGTVAERHTRAIPPGLWVSTNPFANRYTVVPGREAYHTGVDIAKRAAGGGAHEPVSAIANGVVTYAQRGSGTWGNVIVIRHSLPGGQSVYSRYGHVEGMLVRAGEDVWRGLQIASVGNADGLFAYHLHFDLSLTDRLRIVPDDWPGLDLARLHRDYVDPIIYIKANRPMATAEELIRAARDLLDQALALSAPKPTGDGQRATVNSDIGLNVRSTPSIKGVLKGKLANGEQIVVKGEVQGDGLTWCQIAEGQYAGYCVAKQFLAFDVAVQDSPAVLG